MALPEFLKRKPADDARPASSGRPSGSLDAVEKVRTRTRQRLIGAVLLLTLGVIGFPLLFESQPRPIPVDIPIEIPKADGAPALPLPAPRADATAASGVVTRDAPSEPMPAAEAVPPVAASMPTSPTASAAPADKPAEPAAVAPALAGKVSVGAAKATTTEPVASSTAATKAASAAEGAGRFVVQVGAFADPAAAREVRLKMERLGLKTYTQVAETAAGKRIRVRLGPFTTRADADKAQAKAKDAGIAAVVLTL